MATALQIPDQDSSLKRRSVTLSRIGMSTQQQHYSPEHTKVVTAGPVDFPRVRRLNTLKYIVQRPHPALKGKSKSLSGTPSSSTAKELEMEIQETTLHFGSVSSSSSADESDSSVDQDTKDAEEKVLHHCKACHGPIKPDCPFVLFSDEPHHIDCFKCGKCSGLMGSMEIFLVQVDGLPLCYSCSPNCHSCQQKILQNHVSVLKMDFHEECLACFQCKRKFSLVTKIYANQGEPCCSKCISPVFNDKWSPTKLPQPTLAPPPPSSCPQSSKSSSIGRQEGTRLSSLILSPSPSTDSGVSETASNDERLIEECQRNYAAAAAKSIEGIELNPKLESLSRSITLYSPDDYHTLIRPSFSEPNLRRDQFVNGLSISSLKAVLFDECGALLFVNYCVTHNVVEYVVFWLDVEHFKHFDGGREDLKIFAHHIVTKYIGYYADVPVPLTRELQRTIFEKVEGEVSQDMFDEAQQYVYYEMEKNFLKSFLQSSDGQRYLQMLVERDLTNMRKTPFSSCEDIDDSPIRATITNFDKRHSNAKFYVYEVEVKRNNQSYYIYRRYSEWYSLNQALRKAFPLEKFPKLPKKIFLGRSQKRVVAEQRMGELQLFLQGVLSMSNHIVNSVILKKFFKQTESDKEDEIFNRRIQELQERTLS